MDDVVMTTLLPCMMFAINNLIDLHT